MDSAEQISRDNLLAAVNSGLVKTVKIHTASDKEVCESCRKNHGKILKIKEAEIGSTAPPFDFCENPKRFDYQTKNGCRCYWRPEEISLL